MKSSTILKNALTKIKKGWCKGAGARNKNNKPVEWKSIQATKYCVVGAIFSTKFATYYEQEKAHVCFFSANNIPPNVTATWNDNKKRTKKQVVAAFEKAIKRAEKDEAQ